MTDPRFHRVWFSYVGSRDVPSTIAHMLASKVITGVFLQVGQREISDTFAQQNIQDAIGLCHQYHAEIALIRIMWRDQNDLLDISYWRSEIDAVRAERETVGAHCVGFDSEAYVNPLKMIFLSAMSPADWATLAGIVDTLRAEGRFVDYIYPAGSVSFQRPITGIARIGEKRGSEHTYFRHVATTDDINYPFEMPGCWFHVTTDNPSDPQQRPFFIPANFFDQAKSTFDGGAAIDPWDELWMYQEIGLPLAVQFRREARARQYPHKERRRAIRIS